MDKFFKFNIKTSIGGNCPGVYGCNIRIETPGSPSAEVDPAHISRQLNSNSKYMLLAGPLKVKYQDEDIFTMVSPYSTNSVWIDYVDCWQYNKNLGLYTDSESTLFAQINAMNSANSPVDIKVSIYNLVNESITKHANEDSTIVVLHMGSPYSLDGQSFEGRNQSVRPQQERDVVISSTGSCRVLYMEKA